jgi:hypothetical protein
LGLTAAAGGLAIWRAAAIPDERDRSGDPSVWIEVAWPFPSDQWGAGKAFTCKPADCGSEVHVYLRAKLGFCNCATGVANDDDLDRMSDFDLVGGDVVPLAAGRPVRIGTMNGRDRGYALASANVLGRSALSVVFNDRCDMVVATAVLTQIDGVLGIDVSKNALDVSVSGCNKIRARSFVNSAHGWRHLLDWLVTQKIQPSSRLSGIHRAL